MPAWLATTRSPATMGSVSVLPACVQRLPSGKLTPTMMVSFTPTATEAAAGALLARSFCSSSAIDLP